MGSATDAEAWPPLPLEAWSDTAATLHRWLQIVGKIRLGHCAWINHWWHSTLYLTSRGLTTSPMFAGTRSFEIDLDFVDHRLNVTTADGARATLALEPEPVAAFHDRLMAALHGIGLEVRIHEMPNELPDAVPFPEDREHCAYDRDAVNRFWRILVQADRVMKTFRGRFIGKCSPVHLFWGALDMAVTRFSGRPAPRHPGGIPHLPDRVTREAYSHEVSSCGFWPGGRRSATRRSTPTRIRSRRDSPRGGRDPTARSTAPTCASSSCPTASSVRRAIPTRRCSTSSSRPMRRQRRWGSGIGTRSSVREGAFPESGPPVGDSHSAPSFDV